MDRSNDGAYSRTQNISSGRALEGENRPSFEARTPQTSPRLQKKRSNAGAQATTTTTAAATSASANPGVPLRDSAGYGESTKVRKGSFRNAVRRIFGRRSREAESPPPQQRSPPRHGYHRSEPTGLASHPPVPERPEEEDAAGDLPQRTLSAPFETPLVLNRMRSPYAVEFPQSSRLKPLNLGNPFAAPGSQLRRRKTLPSLLIAESDAAALSNSFRTAEAPPVPSLEISRDTTTPAIGTAVGSIRNEKRKSRSADDLRRIQTQMVGLPRKRSDEIRFWRESFQGSVLRASGFRVPSSGGEVREEWEEDKTPLAQIDDPFVTAGPSGTSPSFLRGSDQSPGDIHSPSALGTELSRDLEDRVARLETGLQNFQSALTQLSREGNRRTVLIGGVPTRPASSGGRTASMLAETLQSDLQPSSYQYNYSEIPRPRTSPQPPRTPPPIRTSNQPSIPPMPAWERTAGDPFSSPPPLPGLASVTAGTGNGIGSRQNQPPQHTFRSLYEMLADERSARRRLETQMRGLREEIANLTYQVSVQSNVQSDRSSYGIDPVVGSSRLHALLQETETSPPSTGQSQQQQQRISGLSTEGQPVVSRFSGSESDAGFAPSEDLQTPLEAYQTPAEEQGPFLWDPHGEMF